LRVKTVSTNNFFYGDQAFSCFHTAKTAKRTSPLARDELRGIVGFGVADEITKLDPLKESGSINEVYDRLRAKLV